jgi:hypothetical protein
MKKDDAPVSRGHRPFSVIPVLPEAFLLRLLRHPCLSGFRVRRPYLIMKNLQKCMKSAVSILFDLKI